MEDKELKLEDLFNLLANFFKQNFIAILVFVILGVVLGFVRFTKDKPVYETNFYVQSEFIPVELFQKEVYSIDALIDGRNTEELSKKIGLNEDSLSGFISCNYINISKDDNIFSIEVTSTGDQNNNEQFLSSFTNYLEKNEYIATFLEQEKEKLAQNIQIFEEELSNLETIQKKILVAEGGKNTYSIISNPSEISEQIVRHKNSLLAFKILAEKAIVYTIIDSVTVTTHPSIKKSILTSVIVITFLGFCFIIAFRFFKPSK